MAGSTLSNLELGKQKPWPKARHDLAKALGITEQKLFQEVMLAGAAPLDLDEVGR